MDFTMEQVLFILGFSLSVFSLMVWHDKKKRAELANIEQTTWEPWMDYCDGTPEGDDSEYTHKVLREKFLENYQWASELFGVKACLIKEDNIFLHIDDKKRFNYKVSYLLKYPSNMPTCFRVDDFKCTITDVPDVGYGTKGAELFMREFNEKVEQLKNFRDTNSLEIKYGFSDIYPEHVLKNCVEGCTRYSKSGYMGYYHVKSSLLTRLLKEEKWQRCVTSHGWDDGDKAWDTGRVKFSK